VRFTQVYSRGKDGVWKIVHEHMSMPPTPAGQPQQ
jgi:ketosteroid isomerase-like protein